MITQSVKKRNSMTRFMKHNIVILGLIITQSHGFNTVQQLSHRKHLQQQQQQHNHHHKLYSILPQNNKLFTNDVYETIQNGKIAVIPEFVSRADVTELQRDAQYLYNNNYFTTDALASYGTTGTFDPTKDRTVVKLPQWKDPDAGNYYLRSVELAYRIASVRKDLANNLNRPNLIVGDSVTRYGIGSTEISYTRFGPGASLARHVDEHHEELKGIAGWSQPTRRSLSWLIYLNDPTTWDVIRNGGQLRCYERRAQPPAYKVGTRSNGDLQIGWLRPTWQDPIERPVFLDAQINYDSNNASGPHCAMYIDAAPAAVSSSTNNKEYITKAFSAHPTLFIGGSEYILQKFFITRSDIASRFQLIEAPKSKLTTMLNQNQHNTEESIQDVAPLGGTLVIFDSVALPHEVLPSIGKERWAVSGWFHEDQQPINHHPSLSSSTSSSSSSSSAA